MDLDTTTLNESFAIVTERLGSIEPACVLVLGSGWSSAVDRMESVAQLPYAEVPCLGAPGVSGHAGQLGHYRFEGADLIVFQGRRHLYEGHGWSPVAFPVYAAARWKAASILMTNAAGGIAPAYREGSLMVIRDHINMMGSNPLIGPHDPFWGARFPDQTEVYNRALRERLAAAARAAGADTHTGVYLGATGPVYETPAEINMYRAMGADAVGMSTVPEAMLANAAGIPLAAISCITNMAAGMGEDALDHAEVLATTRDVMPILSETVHHYLAATLRNAGEQA
jgi:purine-nucleoside phosphorylase